MQQLEKYVGSVLKGYQFNNILGPVPIPLIKFMNNNDTHYGLEYKDGINYDILPFDISGICSKGGIYITTVEYWFTCIYGYGDYCREVKIPDDAYVYIESCDRLKCSHIFLGKRERKMEMIEHLLDQYIKNTDSQETIYNLLKTNIYTIYRINPVIICMKTLVRIVKNNGMFLEMIMDVIDPTNLPHELLLEAVKQNGLVLKIINKSNRSFDILLAAVKQNGLALEFIDSVDQTYRLQIEAVKQTGHALQHIEQKSRNREILKHALKNPQAFKYLGKERIQSRPQL